MIIRKKQLLLSLSIVLVLAIALGVSAVFAQVRDQPAAQNELQSVAQVTLQDDGETQDEPEDSDPEGDDGDCWPRAPFAGPGAFGGRGGFRGHGYGPGRQGLTPMADLVAESLGVTVEELQEARTQVVEALIAENDGELRGHRGLADKDESNALLAEALSDISGQEITVETIEAAHDAARQALLEQLPEGYGPTEEQLALMEARQALKDAIDRQAILLEAAEALDLDPVALQEAIASRGGLLALLDEAGVSVEDFRSASQQAFQNAVQNAVPEFITQEQADLILESEAGGPGFGAPRSGHHRPGGHRGFGHFGHFNGFAPQDGDSGTSDTSL